MCVYLCVQARKQILASNKCESCTQFVNALLALRFCALPAKFCNNSDFFHFQLFHTFVHIEIKA